MTSDTLQIENWIKQAFALAADEKPAYSDLYPWLESLFLIQAETKHTIQIDPPSLTREGVETRWGNGFPLMRRSEFPVDIRAAEAILHRLRLCIPKENQQLSSATEALAESLLQHTGYEDEFWASFLQEDLGPWEEWIVAEGLDFASVLFIARSSMRPSFEWTAETLMKRFPMANSWLRGYCPVCGSLPSLLLLDGDGERQGFCSWCSTKWGLHRLQCPQCDNREHDSLGYLFVEAEPLYRIQYCEKCSYYFKQLDVRERLYPPFPPLEEWTTLHLDLLAQRAGWIQAPSPSPSIYGP